MLFHRRISLLSLTVLAILTLSGAGGFAADCNVKDADGNCLGQDCTNIGESTLDNDKTNVIICLHSVKDGPLVWKSMSPNAAQQNTGCPAFKFPIKVTPTGDFGNPSAPPQTKWIVIGKAGHGQSQLFGPVGIGSTLTEGFALCSNGVSSIRVTKFEMTQDCSSATMKYPTVNNTALGGLLDEEIRQANQGGCSPQ